MKVTLLKQMEQVVNDVMVRFLSDFHNGDKPRIMKADFKFPFIWIVGKTHTYLLPLGHYRDAFFYAESVRYDYIREHNPYSYYFESDYYADDYWFLATESGLQSINRDQAKAAVLDYVTPAVQEWITENGPLPVNTKVPVIIQGVTLTKLKELIAECRKHNDDSLMNCLKRFHNYRRVASDQYIKVSYNSAWNEFSFSEYINGKPGLAGGIIFHGWPETGYQSNGSVQIEPQYGWSSHT